jgi:hypothetical protein
MYRRQQEIPARTSYSGLTIYHLQKGIDPPYFVGYVVACIHLHFPHLCPRKFAAGGDKALGVFLLISLLPRRQGHAHSYSPKHFVSWDVNRRSILRMSCCFD